MENISKIYNFESKSTLQSTIIILDSEEDEDIDASFKKAKIERNETIEMLSDFIPISKRSKNKNKTLLNRSMGNWVCFQCSFENNRGSRNCFSCEAPLQACFENILPANLHKKECTSFVKDFDDDSEESPISSPSPHKPRKSKQNNSSKINEKISAEEGAWICPTCSFENNKSACTCFVCEGTNSFGKVQCQNRRDTFVCSGYNDSEETPLQGPVANRKRKRNKQLKHHKIDIIGNSIIVADNYGQKCSVFDKKKQSRNDSPADKNDRLDLAMSKQVHKCQESASLNLSNHISEFQVDAYKRKLSVEFQHPTKYCVESSVVRKEGELQHKDLVITIEDDSEHSCDSSPQKQQTAFTTPVSNRSIMPESVQHTNAKESLCQSSAPSTAVKKQMLIFDFFKGGKRPTGNSDETGKTSKQMSRFLQKPRSSLRKTNSRCSGEKTASFWVCANCAVENKSRAKKCSSCRTLRAKLSHSLDETERNTKQHGLDVNTPQVALEAKSEKEGSNDSDDLCCICLDMKKTVVLLPCKHLCICMQCCEIPTLLCCPMCNSDITEKLRVFS